MEIHCNGLTLFYQKSGNGDKAMLLFHGFGQDHEVLEPITAALADKFTCFSFDLFFHGKSSHPWNLDHISDDHIRHIFSAFLDAENITQFSLLGYSIGTRFVLGLIDSFPSQVENVVFVAPDGIKTSFWYTLATSSRIGRQIFKYLAHHPTAFLNLTRVANRLGVANRRVLTFSESQMNTLEKRQKVYHTWTSFRTLSYDAGRIAKRINASGAKVFIFVGSNDPIIQKNSVDSFVKKVRQITVKEIATGHNGILRQLPAELPQLF